MISDAGLFADYFSGVRRRTLAAARALPEDAVDWSPKVGEFTAGDILRHLASAQQMYWRAFQGEGWRYPGHHRALAPDKPSALALLEDRQRELDVLLRDTPSQALRMRHPDLAGRPFSAWRLLLMMVEHEVHHRSQLDCYLSLLGVTPPHLFGVGVEDLPA